ncbi:MAG: hypothetical protein J7L61_02125 [Thermoplasmata archaeon]|nr:hypothetical protein [Thermoplasmata archaeon]
MIGIVIGAVLAGYAGYRYLAGREETPPPGGEDDGGENGTNVIYYGPGMDRHLLLGPNTTRIIVEVDWVSGYRPSDQALSVLGDRIEDTGGKQYTIMWDDEIITNTTSYTRETLEKLEKEHRDTPPEGLNGEASIYLLCLDGVYNSTQGILGVAYNGTSMAIMEEQIENIDIPLILRNLVSPQDFEASVMVHEMGHLWGLVNIGYESEKDHEDKEHPHHCTHDTCVMYWALETSPSSYIDNFLNTGSPKPPTTFCDDCKYDIQKIADGEY